MKKRPIELSQDEFIQKKLAGYDLYRFKIEGPSQTAQSKTSNESIYFLKNTSLPWEDNQYAHVKANYINGSLDSLEMIESNAKKQSLFEHNDCFYPFQPAILEAVHILKPWGKEVWFTGIENRGVSRVIFQTQNAKNISFKISTLIKVLGPSYLEAHTKSPVLLKILAPSDNPTTGNLYYELHEKKEEVYIVSKVSDKLGTGKMKYGINKNLLEQYKDETLFKQDFHQAVKSYEAIRIKIEQQLEKFKKRDGLEVNIALSNEQLEYYYSELSAALVEEEKSAELAVNQFVGWLDLELGDVISVEKNVPHALQHGVEVIEFQTPVYERFILSFGQRVLTQSHWDVDEGFKRIKLVGPKPQSLKTVSKNELSHIFLVAKFTDFSVFKIDVSGAYIANGEPSHRLVYALKSDIKVITSDENSRRELVLKEGQSCYVAACTPVFDVIPLKDKASFLLTEVTSQP